MNTSTAFKTNKTMAFFKSSDTGKEQVKSKPKYQSYKKHLNKQLIEAYNLLQEIEQTHMLSSDPVERKRMEVEAEKLKKQISGWEVGRVKMENGGSLAGRTNYLVYHYRNLGYFVLSLIIIGLAGVSISYAIKQSARDQSVNELIEIQKDKENEVNLKFEEAKESLNKIEKDIKSDSALSNTISGIRKKISKSEENFTRLSNIQIEALEKRNFVRFKEANIKIRDVSELEKIEILTQKLKDNDSLNVNTFIEVVKALNHSIKTAEPYQLVKSGNPFIMIILEKTQGSFVIDIENLYDEIEVTFCFEDGYPKELKTCSKLYSLTSYRFSNQPIAVKINNKVYNLSEFKFDEDNGYLYERILFEHFSSDWHILKYYWHELEKE